MSDVRTFEDVYIFSSL